MCAHEAWLKELAGDDDGWDLLSFAADSVLTDQGPALMKALSVRQACSYTAIQSPCCSVETRPPQDTRLTRPIPLP